MSGGSHGYLFYGVEEFAAGMESSPDPLRAAFGAHLMLVAKAMHDIEWVDSGDSGPGDDHASISAVLPALAVAATIAERITSMVDTLTTSHPEAYTALAAEFARDRTGEEAA